MVGPEDHWGPFQSGILSFCGEIAGGLQAKSLFSVVCSYSNSFWAVLHLLYLERLQTGILRGTVKENDSLGTKQR